MPDLVAHIFGRYHLESRRHGIVDQNQDSRVSFAVDRARRGFRIDDQRGDAGGGIGGDNVRRHRLHIDGEKGGRGDGDSRRPGPGRFVALCGERPRNDAPRKLVEAARDGQSQNRRVAACKGGNYQFRRRGLETRGGTGIVRCGGGIDRIIQCQSDRAGFGDNSHGRRKIRLGGGQSESATSELSAGKRLRRSRSFARWRRCSRFPRAPRRRQNRTIRRAGA